MRRASSQSCIDQDSAEANGAEIGEFQDGLGEFYATTRPGGRSILTRGAWAHISANAYRYDTAFSSDGGRNWAPFFKAGLRRVK